MKASEIIALTLLALGAVLVYGARRIVRLWQKEDEEEAGMLTVKLIGMAVVLCGLTVLFAS